MLSLFIEKLDNGYVVKVQGISHTEGLLSAAPQGRFFESPAAMADGMPTLVLEAVDAAEGAVALYRQRLAEEQKHWAAQRSAGASGSILGNNAAQSRGPSYVGALPPGFRGVDDANGGDYAPGAAPVRLPEEEAALGTVESNTFNEAGAEDPALSYFREDDGA